MAKTRTKYVCSKCGWQGARMMGRCPNCGEFGTIDPMVEEVRKAGKKNKRAVIGSNRATPQKLSEVDMTEQERLYVPMQEFARVLGGGLVPGSISLIGGEPGIGKCLTGDTRIFDPVTGEYRPITEYAEGHHVLSVDDKLCLSTDKVIAFHERGVNPIVEVTTRLGNRLRCTPEHPVLTEQGWKPIGSLDVGSRLAAPRSLPLKEKNKEEVATLPLQQLASTVPTGKAFYEHSQISALAYDDVYWDEIVSIEPAGEEAVYDLTIENNPNFVANGLIVHNSTIILEIAALIANEHGNVLYVSGEESARQIKMRAERLSIQADSLYLLTETNLGNIFEHVYELDPVLLIIDSIQTTYTDDLDSSPGLVSQVRECASRLQGLAKSNGVTTFLIGHVTKEGTIAGPRVLEHIVDTVMYLEGDPFQAFRLLRSVKNRFGATNEVGVFEMAGRGMIEVTNPSEAFLAERVINASGSAIAVTMEGTRPLLVEIQALTNPTAFGNPRRTSNGVDYNRLLLLSAVLSKRVGLRLFEQDIFVNVIGGLKIDEPASDLATAIAMASSYYDAPVPADTAFIGEIGLSGELRTVNQLPMRLNEAAKIGFRKVVIPKMRRKLEDIPPELELIQVRNVAEALSRIMPKDK